MGAAWHRHYDQLHLHTAKAFSGLPFVPFPRDYPRYPSRLEVIDYLEGCARQFQLEPKLGQQVTAARSADGGWEIQTQDTLYQTLNLVITTGYNREPYLPNWLGQASFRGTLMHSSQYRKGQALKDRAVLVVGFGNSGGEIAIDLWEHGARLGLAVRRPVNVIPCELFGIPILAIAIPQGKLPPRLADALNASLLQAVIGDLTPYGLRRSSHGPLAQIQRDGRIPLIDVRTIKLIRADHMTVYSGIERFTEEGVVFTDGNQGKFDAVILATGDGPRVDAFLEGASAACDNDGTPLCSGRESAVPGLSFCGYNVAPTGMLREIALEARRINAAFARKHAR